MGARLGQECVRITASDFRSMIFPTQYRIPTYNHWLLEEADLWLPPIGGTAAFSSISNRDNPVGQWLLKSPAHLWHLDALATEYPDAIIVQTHRDPLVVVASVSALVGHLAGSHRTRSRSPRWAPISQMTSFSASNGA